MAYLWSRTNIKHRTPGAAIRLAAGLAFLGLVYRRSVAVVTSISVVGCYLADATPIYLGWSAKPQWAHKRGSWHPGRRSNLINLVALGRTASIGMIMIMPPDARAGVSIAVVVVGLFLLHPFTGPHKMRKPEWETSQEGGRPSPRARAECGVRRFPLRIAY
jgi:hypothetical protein